MSNKEKYKQAFSALHVSDKLSLEVIKMTNIRRKQKFNQMVAGVAACVLLVGGSATAYAADLGGIQRTIQLWIHGEQTEVTIEFNADGNERSLTETEILDYLDDPDVRYEDDGSVWIYYFDQKINITDKFDDNVCYARVSNGNETLYLTIKYQNGWSSSPYKYVSPSSFD